MRSPGSTRPPRGTDLPAPPTAHRLPPAVRLRALRKVYRHVVALESVDLDVPAGSILGLVGSNGSGKTTLLRLMLGLARPTSGSVRLLGEPMPASAASVLPHVGALVDGPGFQPFLSGRDNLTRSASAEPLLPTAAIPGAVDAALHRVGLDRTAADRRYRSYSLGMKQRLGLAAVLLAPRRLVVLDEPTNGLDPAGTHEVRRLITELHAAGCTILIASHLLAEVERTCTHVAVLTGGSVVATGELAALPTADDAALEVTTAEPDAALSALRSARVAGYVERGMVVAPLAGTSPEEVLRTLVRAGVPVTEARRTRTGLEELFVRLTEEGS
ncbi:ABC transporter ATP-binding protein [Pseudonocardia acaciae]|uniref:ABC transporter ATP-binding protein n=1 Tax=Pseudonocardia acaciae TaxID=551276 RepID=UPI00068548EF|nr:ABC transporter ATP-binding protein [Pseudonocardia acaciae]